MTDAASRWQDLVERMLADSAATYGADGDAGARRAFGSTSLKTNGRIFAMLVHDRLVVKLPATRVLALVEAGAGRPFDPGHGRIQKEWLDVATDDPDRWHALATESEAFVSRR
jgi:TfoX/Sxy family transcriptional regulator of competence genes